MRLIDADNFEKELSSVWKWLVDRDKKGYGTTHGEMLDKVHDILIKQPTAYDVDSVVEELESLKDKYDYSCLDNAYEIGVEVGAQWLKKKAIKIVKHGGVRKDVE